MFLVYMYYRDGTKPTFKCLTRTKKEAEDYISKLMEGKRYNGLGFYCIEEIGVLEGELK